MERDVEDRVVAMEAVVASSKEGGVQGRRSGRPVGRWQWAPVAPPSPTGAPTLPFPGSLRANGLDFPRHRTSPPPPCGPHGPGLVLYPHTPPSPPLLPRPRRPPGDPPTCQAQCSLSLVGVPSPSPSSFQKVRPNPSECLVLEVFAALLCRGLLPPRGAHSAPQPWELQIPGWGLCVTVTRPLPPAGPPLRLPVPPLRHPGQRPPAHAGSPSSSSVG